MTMADRGRLNLQEARRLAGELMADYVGRVPEKIVHQASGLSNFVFRVQRKKEEFVVRIAPDAARLDAFIKERWAVKKARQHGIPTPEILEVGHKVIPFPYMISHKVHGQEATYHRERLKILEELARYAVRINAVPTNGFGSVFDWARKGKQRHATWTAFLERELERFSNQCTT